MPRYKVQSRNIKAGFFSDAEDKVEKAIQPFLDDGTKNGFVLHSFQATAASKDSRG